MSHKIIRAENIQEKLSAKGYKPMEAWNIRYAYESDCMAGRKDTLAQQIVAGL